MTEGASTTNVLHEEEFGPVPAPLVALTVHEYVFCAVSELTEIGEDAPDPVPLTPPSLETQVAV